MLLCLAGCGFKSAPKVVGNFADIEYFDNHTELSNFMIENLMNDVYACSDAIDDEDMILVIPASEEIKLELYRSVTDQYGNIEPDYECMYGETEPGQAMYFVANFEDRASGIIVVAVNGIGQRAYWSPALDENDDIILDEDFGNGYSVRGEIDEKAPLVQECRERYYIETECDVEEFGVKAVAKNGKVSIIIYDINKYHMYNDCNETVTTLGNGTYPVENLAGRCTGIFVGDEGQNINPILCILLEDQTVQIMQISHAIDNNDFNCSPVLTYCENIVGFVNDGGGLYKDESGQTCFSYMTNYAIDDKGSRYEIELIE